jgi:hypothetical protein
VSYDENPFRLRLYRKNTIKIGKKLQCIQQRAKRLMCVGVEAVADARSIDLTLNPARVFKNFQVLRNRALRQGQHLDNFTADAGLALLSRRIMAMRAGCPNACAS